MIARAVAAAAAAVALQSLAGSPVAFVSDVSGSATIEGDGRLTFLAELEPGTRLFLGSGARAAITFARSGSEFTAAGPGEFLVASDELRAERGGAPARRDVAMLRDNAAVVRAARTATASLRMRSARAAGESAGAARTLQYPVDTRIATLQPVLRWQAANDVTVTLRDEDGRELWSGRTAASTAKPPVKLAAGTRYTWTVLTPQAILGEASFETLAAEPLARAERARASARSFSGRVAHALLLHDLGADQDAKAEWARLARERPDLPELARLAE
jgi:hypothetical protein